MADYIHAYKILMGREFSNNPDKFIHKNKGEDSLTVAGIYRKWHPKTLDWDFVDRVISMCSGNLAMASNLIIKDVKIQAQILQGFKAHYWDKNRLGEIVHQNTANELFISATNIDSKNTIKLAQKLIGVKDDGIIGNITIKYLNDYDPIAFDKEFDEIEIENYERIAKNPRLAHNLKGWKNRARSV